MTIRHHLTDALLLAQAAGALPEALAVAVATHVSLCDDCRARLMACEAVGGALVEASAPAPLAPGALDACLARVAAGAPVPPRRRTGDVPLPLADYVGPDLAGVAWRPLGMGVRQAVLRTQGKATARLMLIPGGAAMPDHGHRGTELTLVLRGAFRDGDRRYGPGDIAIEDETVEHQPVAEPGADCICLAATEGRLRFRGLLPRLAQPFLGI